MLKKLMLYSLLPQALISQPIIFNLFEKIKAIGIHSSSVTLCGRQLFFPQTLLKYLLINAYVIT